MLQTSEAADTQSVRLIQTSTQPNTVANFTLTIEESYKEGDLLPWVKLTLPECV